MSICVQIQFLPSSYLTDSDILTHWDLNKAQSSQEFAAAGFALCRCLVSLSRWWARNYAAAAAAGLEI